MGWESSLLTHPHLSSQLRLGSHTNDSTMGLARNGHSRHPGEHRQSHTHRVEYHERVVVLGVVGLTFSHTRTNPRTNSAHRPTYTYSPRACQSPIHRDKRSGEGVGREGRHAGAGRCVDIIDFSPHPSPAGEEEGNGWRCVPAARMPAHARSLECGVRVCEGRRGREGIIQGGWRERGIMRQRWWV